jgi:DNA-binding GntR family transcriptional regulator
MVTSDDVSGADSEKLAVITRESLASVIYDELEKLIVEGSLDAGDRINENAIAEAHGISRGPVREACRRLEQSGLIEFKVNRGFFVRVIEIEDVLEIYEVRATLFEDAGRRLAACITQAQLDELEDLHQRMERAVAIDDNDVFYRLNRKFHSLTMQFAGNRRLASIYESLDKELHIWRKRVLILDGNVKASCAEHQLILDVLRSGNPSVCASTLRNHSLAGRNRLLRTLPPEGDGTRNARSAMHRFRNPE